MGMDAGDTNIIGLWQGMSESIHERCSEQCLAKETVEGLGDKDQLQARVGLWCGIIPGGFWSRTA